LAPSDANWPPKFIGISFVPWGQVRTTNFYFYFSTLTPIVKTLGLVSVIAPIGIFDLSSTMALTPSVKWALEFVNDLR